MYQSEEMMKNLIFLYITREKNNQLNLLNKNEFKLLTIKANPFIYKKYINTNKCNRKRMYLAIKSILSYNTSEKKEKMYIIVIWKVDAGQVSLKEKNLCYKIILIQVINYTKTFGKNKGKSKIQAQSVMKLSKLKFNVNIDNHNILNIPNLKKHKSKFSFYSKNILKHQSNNNEFHKITFDSIIKKPKNIDQNALSNNFKNSKYLKISSLKYKLSKGLNNKINPKFYLPRNNSESKYNTLKYLEIKSIGKSRSYSKQKINKLKYDIFNIEHYFQMHMKYDNLISKENILYSDTNFSNDECKKRFSEIRAEKLKKNTDIKNNCFIHKEASIKKMNDFNENNDEMLKTKYGKNKATLNIPNKNYRLDKYLSSINQEENTKFTKNENQIIRRNKIVYDYRRLLKESQLFSSDSIVGKNFQRNNEVENKNIQIEKNKNIDNTVSNNEIINNESNENFSLDKFEETKDASLQDTNNLMENNEFKNYDSKINSREELLNLKELENVEDEISNVADNELPKTTEINQSLQMTDNTKSIKSNQDLTNPSSKKYEDNSQDLKQSNENLTEDNILILNPTLSENKITTDLESVHNIQSISKPQENPPTIIYSEKINKDNSINSDNNEFSEKSLEISLSEETNNAKRWKKYYYFIEPPNTFEKKLACIIRFKSGSIPKRTSLRCELVNSFEEVPYLDKKEDYASYIFKINPKDSDTIFQFENPWYISIPYYPLLSKAKQPIILIKNDELNKWIECNTNIITSDKIKENDFTFVETRMFKPHGTFTVVSSTIKDVVVITKEGNQIRSMIDKNIMLAVPPNSLRISINASIQVNSIDNLFWKEIKDKHGKGILDQIDFTSAIVEIEAKKKKLINSATLTLNLPDKVIKYPEINPEIRDQKSEIDDSKIEDDKIPLLERDLNPFQKTLMMKQIINTNQVLDVNLLSYINEEDKWTITKENSLSCHDNTNQISIQIPIIQSSKIMLLQSKRNTNEETLTRAAKLIENEFCIRNCTIALFQSTQILNEFALIVSQRKYFQRNLKILQDDGYVLDTKNKLVYVELQERQIITTKFVGNVRNVNLNACETLFTFHSLFPNIQKFRVQEIDPYAQRAVLTFRGYLNLYTTSLVKRPINNVDSKIRKNQIQYTWAEENVMICHLLICISKRKLPLISSFVDYQFRFKNYRNCLSIIKVISRKIGLNWWDLGLHLGVTETRMESIKLHNQDRGLNKMAESMLLFWLKGCETQENKVELLKFALKSCGRSEIIDRIYKSQENNLIFGC